MYIHFAVLGVLAFFIAVGLFYRLSTILFFFGFTYVFLIEQAAYLNHLYLVCWVSFLMIFLPANRCWSVDVRRNPLLHTDHVPAWTLWLLRLQIGLVYFWGGIAKLNVDWLRAQPLLEWMENRSDYALIGGVLSWDPTAWFMSYSGLLIDLCVPFLLLFRSTRMPALVVAISFHLFNLMIFSIGIFPYFMIATTLLFLDPDWPRNAFGRWFPQLQSVPRRASLHRAVVPCMIGFFAMHTFLPLRHWLYPGNVSWTEEGHLFAWHMKLRSKNSRIQIQVTDPETGEKWRIRAMDYLSERQRRKMSTRPELLRQFAHHLAEEMQQQGHGDVEVRMRVRTSLNSRPRQLLVDPDVDLSKEPYTQRPASWIIPLKPDLDGW